MLPTPPGELERDNRGSEWVSLFLEMCNCTLEALGDTGYRSKSQTVQGEEGWETYLVFDQFLDPVHDGIISLSVASTDVSGLVPPIGRDRLLGRGGIIQVTLSERAVRSIRTTVLRAPVPS